MHINWILVPIDFSKDSRCALDMADSQAGCSEAGLILLHVQQRESPAKARLAIDYGPLEKWARFVKKTPQTRIAFITCHGRPDEEILRVAQQYNVRSIIMGRGGKGEQVGKVTQAVLTQHPRETECFSSTKMEKSVAA